MRTHHRVWALALAAGMGLSCSGRTESPPAIGTVRATLRRATSCADLESALKTDALAKMNAAIDAQERALREHGVTSGVSFAVPKSADAGTATAASNESAATYSKTNTQVAGVDEADIVKTDGKYIYLVHGQSLEILSAWPAASLSTASSVSIEGEPSEMFQWGDKIVVYSRVDGRSVYAAAGVTPRATYQDYVYGGSGVADVAVAPSMPTYGGWLTNPLAKITVLDVQNGKATVARELYFEGETLSSRRIGPTVRSIFSGAAPGPAIKLYPETPPLVAGGVTPAAGSTDEKRWIDAWTESYETLRRANVAAIQASKVADWIPYAFAKDASGAVTARTLACEDFYLPTPGTTSYGLVHVESFDATIPASPVKTAAIIGAADTVYSSDKTMVLAAHAWIAPDVLGTVSVAPSGTAVGGAPVAGSAGSSSGAQSVHVLREAAPGVTIVSMDATHLHAFDIATDPTTALYFASGSVVGSIANQFAIDERAGVVRVTTTEHRGYAVATGTTAPATLPRTANHVFALREAAAEGRLDVVGDVGDLAPGETIMSTRFVGDRAYVVTYLQKDPLFVVDLQDATALRVVGQLTIPGFSSYMHPLDDGHLLTIGQDGGLALQIFDVTNPAAPAQMHKFVFENSYGYSEAQSNHKAFTYYPEKKLLAFPFVAYGPSAMKSTLEVFSVDLASGFHRLGAVDHTAFFPTSVAATRGYCGGYYEPIVRRGVFLENVVFSISYGGVLANDAATLAPVASLALPAPTLTSYGACGAGDGGTRELR